jgi:hypothetical protein
VSYNSLQEFLLLNTAYLVAFVACRSYIGAFRHTGVRDLIRLGYSAMLGGFLVFTISRLANELGWFDTNTEQAVRVEA